MTTEASGAAATRLLLVLPDPALVHAAVRSGLQIRLILDEDQRAADFNVDADRVIRVNKSDQEELDSAIASETEKYEIDYALSADGTPLEGKISAGGGRTGDTRNPVHLLNDARAMRSILIQSGLWYGGLRPADWASRAAVVPESLGSPTAVRPARYVPANGPRADEQPAGLRLAVTTLTVAGMHSVLGIAAWQPPPLGPGYIYPAALSEADQKSVRAAARSVLDLAGYQFGPAQTNMVLTSSGPQIVRTYARFGVDQIPRLIELATGLDLRTELFRALAGAPFRTLDPHWFAAVGFLPELVSVSGAAAFPSRARVLALPGVSELHVPTATGSLTALGSANIEHAYVITEGVTREAVTERMARARQLLS